MALFPQSFIDDLKAQTDIVSVIGEVTPLRRTGATWKGLCPFHQEKTPSFNVNPDKGFFKCFGCGVGGDVVKFVELQQKLSFPEAVRYLATRAGMPVPEVERGPEDRAAAAEREEMRRCTTRPWRSTWTGWPRRREPPPDASWRNAVFWPKPFGRSGTGTPRPRAGTRCMPGSTN